MDAKEEAKVIQVAFDRLRVDYFSSRSKYHSLLISTLNEKYPVDWVRKLPPRLWRDIYHFMKPNDFLHLIAACKTLLKIGRYYKFRADIYYPNYIPYISQRTYFP